MKNKKYPNEEWQKCLEAYQQEDGNWMVCVSDGNELVGMMEAFQTLEDRKNNAAQIIGVYVKEAF